MIPFPNDIQSAGGNSLRYRATLLLDGHHLSNGQAILEASMDRGAFLSTDLPNLDSVPYQQATLTLRGKFGVLRLANFRRAPSVTPLYLFEAASESQGS